MNKINQLVPFENANHGNYVTCTQSALFEPLVESGEDLQLQFGFLAHLSDPQKYVTSVYLNWEKTPTGQLARLTMAAYMPVAQGTVQCRDVQKGTPDDYLKWVEAVYHGTGNLSEGVDDWERISVAITSNVKRLAFAQFFKTGDLFRRGRHMTSICRDYQKKFHQSEAPAHNTLALLLNEQTPISITMDGTHASPRSPQRDPVSASV